MLTGLTTALDHQPAGELETNQEAARVHRGAGVYSMNSSLWMDVSCGFGTLPDVCRAPAGAPLALLRFNP